MGNLCTLASVKARLGLAAHDVDDDTVLANFIKLVSARFESACRRAFDRQAATTQEFDGDATELRLQRYPVEAVSAWHLKSSEAEGWVEQDEPEYVLRASSRGVPCVLSLYAALGTWRQRLRVTYTGGYVLPGASVGAGQTALPDDLQQAAIEQTVAFYRMRDKVGVASASGGEASMTLQSEELLPTVRETLRLHEFWQP